MNEEELKEIFEMFDRDNDGLINQNELGNILRTQGYFPSDQDLKDMIASVDADEDNLIEFSEMISLLNIKDNKKEEAKNDLLEAFRFFDKQNTGNINIKEFRQIMKTLGDKITDEEVDEMLKYCDSKENINYNLFIDKITN